ncbi:MAG: mobilization protein [Proteobacteria bacterium]|nr:mobilization protein [Pseudomonadota bacterium]
MASAKERLAALEARTAALRARIGKKTKAEETRRKILLGTWVLERAEQDAALREKLVRELPGFLVHARDREVLADLIGSVAASAPPKPRLTGNESEQEA